MFCAWPSQLGGGRVLGRARWRRCPNIGALTPLVIADIMRGTGRYNLAQGAIATVQGIGASLSGLVAGVIVDNFGYSSAFLALAAAAAAALTVFALGMPETADRATASLPS